MYAGAGRRALRGGGAVRRAAASVHHRPARLDPAPAPRAGAPRRDRRPRCPTPRRCRAGCRFHPRCPFAIEKCRREELRRCWTSRPDHVGRVLDAAPLMSQPLLRAEQPGQALSGAQRLFGARGRAGGRRRELRARSRARRCALVGESGCGKSTTGRLRAAPDRADRGPGLLRRPRPLGAAASASCARCGARCRSSSRTRTARSIRA